MQWTLPPGNFGDVNGNEKCGNFEHRSFCFPSISTKEHSACVKVREPLGASIVSLLRDGHQNYFQRFKKMIAVSNFTIYVRGFYTFGACCKISQNYWAS